ncbi:MAG: acetate--CoA ligase [Bdellovibrionaceae bacterium]|nr:acetate--CoA ligase [Pseudobdellovibrionaceae bacterium]|tara:strand:+ start:335 stop:2230 length:1896 start_codon:yes stop_codon:yes gene_type:complete
MFWQIKSYEEYQNAYKKSLSEPEEFWGEIAKSFQWKKEFDSVQSGDFKKVDVKWFEGGILNITENALDRHLEKRGNHTALIFEPNEENSETKKYTFQELYTEVCKTANMLKSSGVKKGDRVCLYMSMVPELLISLLACARIGAVHTVVFGGFSAKALSDRINDCECSLLITNDGGFRGEKTIPLKEIADEALKTCPSISKVIIHRRTYSDISLQNGRDFWWHDLQSSAASECPAEPMQSEDPLFILYTSGSTGKPKGVVHTTAGYMVWGAYTFRNVFQINDKSIYWCSADIGWVTGHTYLTYAPLINGITTVMFEGVPNYPHPGRFWNVIEKHKVSHFYTAPTAIRALMGQGDHWVERAELSSLKVLGTVGEPINEEAWIWYHDIVGRKKCPVVDTWWQTETGGIMISNLAGVTPMKPSYATLPLPGVEIVLKNDKGTDLTGNNIEGNLCIKRSWPGIARTVFRDHDRFKQTYFSTYEGYYFTGDGCKKDENGLYRITGRVDDVINVSGHRIGTAEVEDAIDLNPHVIESAVVGYPHDIKGQGIYAFLICDQTLLDQEEIKKSILKTVTQQIGPIAKPDKIQIVSGLPKTRSGKIMRRILRKIASGETENLGDTSTLLDPQIVEELKEGKV